VGTSIIKELGRTSIEEVKKGISKKDSCGRYKDNRQCSYEFEMCYNAGADVATVMGVSPIVTIQSCLSVAKKWNKKVMRMKAKKLPYPNLKKQFFAIMLARINKKWGREKFSNSNFQ
jgi:3-keto-L-gulonate-6-phosphate decarboxylase